MEEQQTTGTERRTTRRVPDRAQPEPPTTRRKVFDLEERLLEFASAVIDISESLPKTRAGNHVAGQLLRSGTSPCSNHGEAESAESTDDFIHKMKLCLKELRETGRWLRLINRKRWLGPGKDLPSSLAEVEELIRIFVASIRTAELNRKRRFSASAEIRPGSVSPAPP